MQFWRSAPGNMMSDLAFDSAETVLRQCAAVSPNPWYPSEYAPASGIARNDLDQLLDRLRLAGLIRLTDWVQGKGQGYLLTPTGIQLLQSERDLARLRNGTLRPRPVEAPAARESTGWRASAWERGEAVRSALHYRPNPVMTRALILINCLVFAAGTALAVQRQVALKDFLSPENDQQALAILHETGALDSADVLVRGQWWRLLSCCFVHIGLIHLAVNMVSLWSVGRFVEVLVGQWRFLVLYLLSGLTGSCAMVLVNPPLVLGAGASGAIWGLMIALVVWVFLHRREIGRQSSSLLGQLVFIVILNVYISTLPGISAAAHFAGGAGGLVAGLLLNLERFGRGMVRGLALIGLILFPVLCIGTVVAAKNAERLGIKRAWLPALGKDAEVAVLEDDFLPPPVKEDVNSAAAAYVEVQPLLDLPFPERNRSAEAAALLESKLPGLAKALEVAREAGPFRPQEVERNRQVFERFLADLHRLIELAARRLRLGLTWTQKEEDEFRQLNRRLKYAAAT
jgi:membrane associated rhomboid family serine protease